MLTRQDAYALRKQTEATHRNPSIQLRVANVTTHCGLAVVPVDHFSDIIPVWPTERSSRPNHRKKQSTVPGRGARGNKRPRAFKRCPDRKVGQRPPSHPVKTRASACVPVSAAPRTATRHSQGNIPLPGQRAARKAILEYKCMPAEFERSLLRCEVLADCCAELRANGIPTQRSWARPATMADNQVLEDPVLSDTCLICCHSRRN